MTRVGLIFGGRTVEHEVSVRSARTVAAGLRDAGHTVVPLGIAMDGCWVAESVALEALSGGHDHLIPRGEAIAPSLSPLLESKVDVLFPIIHGTWGEDGTLQGLCEMAGLPYVGTGVTSSAIAMDKIYCKQILEAHGLPVVGYEVVTRAEFERSPEKELERLKRFAEPLVSVKQSVFVKPSVGGSSVGVSRVPSLESLESAVRLGFRFDDRLLLERGIVGRELECAVLGYKTLEASVIGEIVPGKDFYDYADKYIDDTAKLLAPADLPETLSVTLRRMATGAFSAVGGWGMARVDFLVEQDGLVEEEGKGIYINEINTLPGFTSISMYPTLWGLTDIPLPKLVDRLVHIALERHADRQNLDEGIKGWIAALEGSS